MKAIYGVSLFAVAVGSFCNVASAQTAPATAPQAEPARPDERAQSDDQSGDIIVTARKRNETALDVPVSITALGEKDLTRYGTNSLQSLATRVPGFFASDASSSGTLAIRGISSTPGNPAADQGVSINVDGLQVGAPQTLRLAQIDLQQVEVLKGPQALFFGKNSPGGIVSLKTADPGDHFVVKGILDYEFESRERAAQVVLSGPLTDTLGIRLVGYYNKMDGDVRQNIPVISGVSFGPLTDRTPNQEQTYVRGTIVFRPTDNFNIRGKYSYSYLVGSNPFGRAERVFCPYGAPQVLGLPTGVDDCRPNGVSSLGAQLTPAMYAAGAAAGFPFDQKQRTKQNLGSLEANFVFAPDVTLTSLTGYFKLETSQAGSISFQPAPYLTSITGYTRREITQELRIVTARADWPVNFTVGAYYQDLDLPNVNVLLTDSFAATRILPLGQIVTSRTTLYDTKGSTYSAFGQAIWKITPKLELTAGARYSSEKKSIALSAGTTAFNQVPAVLSVNQRTFNNFSPEITVLYKPLPGLSLFGAFRNGFKSGGFNAAGTSGDLSYKPEDIKGFEGGVKGKLGDFRFNATAYTYKYTNAQVYSYDPSTNLMNVLNAASSRIKGVEANVTWTPRNLAGLELHGSANYNHARYLANTIGCYTGQTVAEGCSVGPIISGGFKQQDLTGRPLVLAPDWTGNAGFNYRSAVGGSGLHVGVSGDMTFSSRYVTILEDIPGSRQPSFQKYDASIRVGNDRQGWELALIGANLSDVRTINYAGGVPLTGSAARTGTTTTGGRSDVYGFVSRGREIRLQLSVGF